MWLVMRPNHRGINSALVWAFVLLNSEISRGRRLHGCGDSQAGLEQALRLLQLEAEAHFSEAARRPFECFTRRLRSIAFQLVLAHSDMRAGQVGLVAVSHKEFEALGELGGRGFERSLLGE